MQRKRAVLAAVAIVVLAAVLAAGVFAWRQARRAGAPTIGNAGFEDGLDGWTAAGATGVVRGAANAHSGDAAASLRVAETADPSGRSDARISQDGLRVAKGRTYRLSLWARGEGAPTLEAWVVRRGKERFRAGVWPMVASRWTQLDAEWTAPRADEVRIDLVAHAGDVPVPGAVLVDDVSVAEVAHPAAHELTGEGTLADEPSVARGADGSLWATWLEYAATGEALVAARLERTDGAFVERGRWTVELATKTSVAGPRVVAGPGGVSVVCAAERGDDWQIVAVPLTNDGPGTKVELGNGAAVDCKPAAAFRDKALWIAWESNAGGERQIWAASVVGGKADEPFCVSAGPADADGEPAPRVASWTPSIAVTDTGRVAVAWHQFADGNTDVMLRVRDSQGIWDPIRRVTTAPTIDRQPVLCAHGDDLWIAWENANSLGVRQGHTVDRRIEVARVTANGLETPVGGLDASPLGRSAERPALAFDDAGRLRVAFLRPRRADQAWQVWTTSWDGGAWSPPTPASPRKGLCRAPGIAVDRGDLVVALQADDYCTSWGDIDRTPDAHSAVFVTRVAGAPGAAASPPKLEPLVEPADAFGAAGVDAQFGDASARVTEAYFPVPGGEPEKLRLLFGDLHEHSDISICGKIVDDTPDLSWQSMRDFPHLDFGVITDHGENFNEHLWHLQAKEARMHDDPGRFVAFLGEEWTSQFKQALPGRPHGYYGHRNLVFADLRLPRWWNPRNGQTPQQVWDEIRATGSDFVVIPHQLADTGNVPVDWSFADEVAQPVAEMYQHRGSYEALGAPRQAGRGLATPGWYVHDLLAKGLVFGFVAAPDHGGTEGKACVWAKEFTRKGILDALRARRCYATTGARIVLDVGVNDHVMGTEDTTPLADGDRVRVKAYAECPGEIDKVEVCRDGVFHPLPCAATRSDPDGVWSVAVEWTDLSAKRPSRTWTYVRVTQKDGEMAWSSPVWLGPRRKGQ